MKKNAHKMMEQFMDEVMNETSLESPSPDFTNEVMAAISLAELHKAPRYKPVISKAAWVVIFGIMIAAIAIVSSSSGGHPAVAYSFFGPATKGFFRQISNLNSIQFSQVTVMIVTVSMFLLIIQITLLSNYLNRRFQK